MRARLASALGLVVLLCACTVIPVRDYHLSVRILNDSNNLLVVEGDTNLPEGAPVEAGLYDGDGRRLSSSRGLVEQGRYFVVLDVSTVPGFSHHTLVVSFDPLLASSEILDITGHRGEAMRGDLVEYQKGRNLLVSRTDVMLVVESRQAGYRELQEGDLAAAIRELESYLARNPHDTEAMISLGLAYLEWRQAERRVGTRAHVLLQRAIELAPESERAVEARLWISRLEAEERARRAEIAFRRSVSVGPGSVFHSNKTVVPGEALGAIRLGMPYRALIRRLAPDNLPAFEEGVETVSFSTFHGLTVGIDSETSKVVWASSDSEFFRLDGDLGVGSLLQEFQGKLKGVYTPAYGPEKRLADGSFESFGVIRLDGLVLYVRRTRDAVVGIPVDTVVEIQVI